ncbi:o-succinylbenzoate synthase [Staphylococcus sp. SQ8-PEA]|uniref:o-succinylbenzoate synthase n=1 Tax=Staphylococcus marylandisciuri TaxID=2981529 RepID=A0ABT2QS61_9STAP|nr:o-succinylbenzoate synthase [Staphylococcus marylandisciuri]MCU5746820.1 o-succinylbenzoate synthase [Staphylococcus marylandisciuri]
MRLVSLNFYLVDEPFKQAIVTPKIRLDRRKALIIELITEDGKNVYGECNAFETNWYADTVISDVKEAIEKWFIKIKNKKLCTYQEALHYADMLKDQQDARHTVVMALYQLFHKLPTFRVEYGATVNGMTNQSLQYIKDNRPKRVKVKWSSTIQEDIHGLQSLDYQPLIALDANESLTKPDIAELEKIAESDILYIEEPFKKMDKALIQTVSHLVPVAIDEKATSIQAIEHLVSHYDIKVVVIKPFRLGGMDKAMEVIQYLGGKGIQTVVGGMYEYGLSKYFTALLSSYAPLPGDITPEGYYFERDIVRHGGKLEDGYIKFEPPQMLSRQLKSYE